MNNNREYTLDGVEMGLQVSIMGNVNGSFDMDGLGFYLKNNSQDPVEVTIVPAGAFTPLLTTLFPGWNPEVVKSITTESTVIQWGR